MLDIQGNNIELTNAENGVNFDLNADGIAERIAWAASGADDAFLGLDRNGNGTIDNGKELFGNFTSQSVSNDPNGFRALAEFDKPENGGNGDRMINLQDAVFTSLRLWQDINHNGVSETNELHTLSELNVESISLDFKLSNRRDAWGNTFRYRAKVFGTNHSDLGRWAYDVFLLTDQTQARADADKNLLRLEIEKKFYFVESPWVPRYPQLRLGRRAWGHGQAGAHSLLPAVARPFFFELIQHVVNGLAAELSHLQIE
jgi:hypothetical protein